MSNYHVLTEKICNDGDKAFWKECIDKIIRDWLKEKVKKLGEAQEAANITFGIPMDRFVDIFELQEETLEEKFMERAD